MSSSEPQDSAEPTTTIQVLGALDKTAKAAIAASESATQELRNVRGELAEERWWRRILVPSVVALFVIVALLFAYDIYTHISTDHATSTARTQTFRDLNKITIDLNRLEGDFATSRLSQTQIKQILNDIEAATGPQARAQGAAATAAAIHQLELYVQEAEQAEESHQPIPSPSPLGPGG